MSTEKNELHSSPDLLSEQCVSAYLMRETAEDKIPQLTQSGRERLPRAAKSSEKRQKPHVRSRKAQSGNSRGGRSRGRAPPQSDQSIDDEKHNRAMDVLYHLQQRQEQVLAVLDDELPEDDINVEGMLEEISAIEEALSRLTRIFKLAKDELNNSQCFPNTVREDSSFKRKQLQMNTRLTKCSTLAKMQSLLDEKFVKFKESFQAHNETTFQSVSGEPSASEGDSSVFDSTFHKQYPDGLAADTSCERETADTSIESVIDNHMQQSICSDESTLFPSPTRLNNQLHDKIPFSQDCYSSTENQPKTQSQAQSILDELFAETADTFSQEKPPTAGQENHSQGSVVAWFNDKLFVSPPRKPLQPLQSNNVSFSSYGQRKRSHSDSLLTEDINTTGVFEPSQSPAISTQFSQPLFSISHLDKRGKTGIGDPVAASTQLSIEAGARARDSADKHALSISEISQGTDSNLFTTADKGGPAISLQQKQTRHGLEKPQKFILLPDTKVEIISDAELREWPSDLIPPNIWDQPGFDHFTLPEKLLDMLDDWD